MQSIRSFKVENCDESFEVKRTSSFQGDRLKLTGYKVVFGMAYLTPCVARKLAAWLLKAADFCETMNAKKFA